MVCYEIGLKNRSKLESMDYLYESEAYAVIFYVNMNTKYFKKVSRMTAYVHENRSSKIIDASASYYHNLNDDHYIMRVTYQTLFMKRLQPPYETMCQSYPTDSSRIEWNLNKIQEKTVKELNMSIPSMMIYQPLDTRILFSKKFEHNVTLREKYEDLLLRNMYSMPVSCIIKTTIPRIYFVHYPNLGVTLLWPDGLHFNIESKPRILSIDFIVYVCSCIGIWFGLSIFSVLSIMCSKLNLSAPAHMSNSRMLRPGMNRQELIRFNRMESRLELALHFNQIFYNRIERIETRFN